MNTAPNYSSLILLTVIPLIIGDFYFGYKDFSCAYIPIQNTHIGFTLSTWLKVSAWTGLLFITLPIINYFLSNITRLLVSYLIFALLYALFRFIWLIIGAVMFWGYLCPNRFCADALNTYMWVNLIYSFIICLATCYLQQQTYVSSKQNRLAH